MSMACSCHGEGKKAERKIRRIQGSGMQSLESLILDLTISSEQITFKIPFFSQNLWGNSLFILLVASKEWKPDLWLQFQWCEHSEMVRPGAG